MSHIKTTLGLLLDAHHRRRAAGSTTVLATAISQAKGILVVPTVALAQHFEDLIQSPARVVAISQLGRALGRHDHCPIALDNSTVMMVCQDALDALEAQEKAIARAARHHLDTVVGLRRQLRDRDREIERLKAQKVRHIRVRRKK